MTRFTKLKKNAKKYQIRYVVNNTNPAPKETELQKQKVMKKRKILYI